MGSERSIFKITFGYHLQQAVELNLKYQLEMSGIEYPKTHDIDQLLRIGKENGADLLVTEYIEDHSEMFSLWEARTRYVLNYHLEERKIDVALKGVKELLDKTSDLIKANNFNVGLQIHQNVLYFPYNRK